MRHLLAICWLMIALSVGAATSSRISIDIAITNVPVTGNTIALNGAVRTWTNAHSSTTILTNLVDVNASATNLFNNYGDFPISGGITRAMTATNTVTFTAPIGLAFSGSATGNWATVTIRTQAGPTTFTALWPLENIAAETNRTNQGSALVYGMGIYSTNAFPTNSTAVSNHVTKGASPEQIVASPLTVGGALRARDQLFATNGFTSSITNINQVSSNGVNYGTAFSSPGAYPGSQQFGGGAAGGGNATVLGTSSSALTNGVGIGWFASAGHFSIAIGASADSSAATNSIAIGQGANIASASNAIAIGKSTVIGDRHHDSVVIGTGSTSTTNNQIVLGASTHTVLVPGMLSPGTVTNATLRGTNIINGQLVITPASNTGLANGYNSAIGLSAASVKFSGPSAAYTNVGFSAANKMDGKMHFCQFDNPGLSISFLHDSGLESGDTNRIYTGTGALLNSTNNPVQVIMSYDTSVNRWRIWSIR